MTTSRLAAILVGASIVLGPAPTQAQDVSDFVGRWTLNRELSQFPREIGFDADWLPASGGTDATGGGGRGGRKSGGGSAAAFTPRRESEGDAKRVQQLTAEVRDSSAARAMPPESRGVPVSGEASPAQAFNQQPGAELKGLKKLGVVVEGLGSQAAACGLKQETLEAAVSKQLSDAEFTVQRTSDEDTYVYVNVITASLSTGLCVSRYDVSLNTYTTAALSYQKTPVLVQVSLLHKGGLTGGAPAVHADAVLKGVQGFVDQFTTQIRDANK